VNFLDVRCYPERNVTEDEDILLEAIVSLKYNMRNDRLYGDTGCGKLTSFFEYEMPYEKGC
jgi:hypothetical protein